MYSCLCSINIKGVSDDLKIEDFVVFSFSRFSILGPNTTIHHYGSLLISDVSLSDAGMYVCTVSNKHGQDNITITLRVQGNRRLI